MYQPVGPTTVVVGAGAAAACGGVVAVVHPSKWVGAQPTCVQTVAAVPWWQVYQPVGPTCSAACVPVPHIAGLVTGLAVTVVHPIKCVGGVQPTCVQTVAAVFPGWQVYHPVTPMVPACGVACCGQVSVTGGIPQPWNQVAIVCGVAAAGVAVAVVQPNKCVGGVQPTCVQTVAAVPWWQVYHPVTPMVPACGVACCGQVSVTGGIPQPWNQVPIVCGAAPAASGVLVTVVQPGISCVCAMQVCQPVWPMVCGFNCASFCGQKGACVSQAMLVAHTTLAGSGEALVSCACGQVAVAAGLASAGLFG